MPNVNAHWCHTHATSAHGSLPDLLTLIRYWSRLTMDKVQVCCWPLQCDSLTKVNVYSGLAKIQTVVDMAELQCAPYVLRSSCHFPHMSPLYAPVWQSPQVPAMPQSRQGSWIIVGVTLWLLLGLHRWSVWWGGCQATTCKAPWLRQEGDGEIVILVCQAKGSLPRAWNGV